MTLSPAQHDSAFEAFERAVAKANGYSGLARIVGCTPANISQHYKARRLLPARFVIAAEVGTGVSRHDLRPDIYPREEDTSPPRTPAQHAAAQPSAPAKPPHPAGADGLSPALDYAPGADPLKGMAA